MNTFLYEHRPRYRSIKYKVSHSQSIIGSEARKTFSTKVSTPAARPHRTVFGVGSSLTKIKRFSQHLSHSSNSMARKFETATYIDSFHEIANLEKQSKSNKEHIKALRVYLPNLDDVNPSKFTLLDPIKLPISFIEDNIQEAKDELERQKDALRRVKQEIPIFQMNQIQKLQQIEAQGHEAIKKLGLLLKSNKVFQQETVLRSKKSGIQLRAFIGQHKVNFESTHKRVTDLQNTIFNSQPFELQQKEEYEAVSTKYF